MNILFKPVDIDGGMVGVNPSMAWTQPTRGTPGAAGWDLYASEDRTLSPFHPCLVPTDLEIAIPEGHMMLVLPRSGNSLKKQIIVPNSPGLIDEDYRGHLQVILTWIPNVKEIWNWTGMPTGSTTLEIKKGERIAQAVLVPYAVQNWIEVGTLPKTDRGAGGFGSTGG